MRRYARNLEIAAKYGIAWFQATYAHPQRALWITPRLTPCSDDDGTTPRTALDTGRDHVQDDPDKPDQPQGDLMVGRMRRSLVVVAAILGLTLFAVPSAAAVEVPITMNFAGTFELFSGPACDSGIPVTDTVTGISSHLGQMTGTYPHCVNFAAATFSGTATFVAANGDELIVLLWGFADDPTCTTICDVEFTGSITGGTGRFVGAQGSLAGTGTVNLNPGVFTVESMLTGTINKNP